MAGVVLGLQTPFYLSRPDIALLNCYVHENMKEKQQVDESPASETTTPSKFNSRDGNTTSAFRTMLKDGSPQLTYIPPGLTCKLGPTGDRPVVHAIGGFAVGHIWGPYLTYMSPECRQLLLSLDEKEMDITHVMLSVKQPGIPLNPKSIVLGEEHVWIQLVQESGLVQSEAGNNIDLVIDPHLKTITLSTVTEVAPDDALRGTLRFRTTSAKAALPTTTMAVSNPSATAKLQMTPYSPPKANTPTDGALTVGLPTPGSHQRVGDGRLPPLPLTSAPRRDKRCAYCDIQFTHMDTLSAHMAYYCSRRPQAAQLNPQAPTLCTSQLAVGSASAAVATATNNPSNEAGGPHVLPGKQPTSQSNSNPGIFNPQLMSTQNITRSGKQSPPCEPPYQSETFGNVFGRPPENVVANGSVSEQGVIGAAESLLHSYSLTALARALLPYLIQMKASTSQPMDAAQSSPATVSPSPPVSSRNQTSDVPCSSRVPRQANTELAGQTKPGDRSVSKPTGFTCPVTSGGETQAATHYADNQQPKTSPTSQQNLISTWYCDKCRRYFGSWPLYACHLQVSGCYRNLDTVNTATGAMDDVKNKLTFAQLASQAHQFGLVLAAPLLTDTGLQYLPVNPACGSLTHQKPHGYISQRHNDTAADTLSASSSQVVQTNPTNVLDLSLTQSAMLSDFSAIPKSPASTNVPFTSSGCIRNGNSTQPIWSRPGRPPATSMTADGNLTTNSLGNTLRKTDITSGSKEGGITTASGNPTPDQMAVSPLALTHLLANMYTGTLVNSFPWLQCQQGWDPAKSQLTWLDFLVSQLQQQRTYTLPEQDSKLTPFDYHKPMPDPQFQTSPMNNLFNQQGLAEGFPDSSEDNEKRKEKPVHSMMIASETNGDDERGMTRIQPLSKFIYPSNNNSTSSNDPFAAANNIHRPFLCNFCQTRFQAYSTFQAHQQYYCQARHRKTRNTRAPLCPSPQGAALTPAPTVKRRRLTPSSTAASPTNLIVSSPMPSPPVVQEVPIPCVETRLQSSPIVLDEPERAEEHSSAGSHPMELPVQNDRSGDLSAVTVMPTSGRSVELRCLACGYVGQTARGMKMHRRLHECDGSSCTTSRKAAKIQRPDSQGGEMGTQDYTVQPTYTQTLQPGSPSNVHHMAEQKKEASAATTVTASTKVELLRAQNSCPPSKDS